MFCNFLFEKLSNNNHAHLSGIVTTENNGGFIQIRTNLIPELDSKKYDGIYFNVYGNNNVEDVKKYLVSGKFGLGAYKGVKVSFRSWNHQLRQPILISAPRSMVTVSPQEGYIHPFSELDTIGVDKPESTCKF